MDLLLWIAIGFIIIGFAVLFSMKTDMESKIAFIKENPEDEGNSSKAKSVIWWVWGTTGFGMVSIYLVVWCFDNYFG